MDDNGQQVDCSFAFMTSLAASGPWPTWPFQAPQLAAHQIIQKETVQAANANANTNANARQDMQWLAAPPQQQVQQHLQLQPSLQQNPSPKDSNLMNMVSMPMQPAHRSCTTTPSPSPSPNSCLASTLSFNFPSTPATSSYSTPASSSTTNPSNRRPRPPSLNIPPLCLSAINSYDSNSPTAASAVSLASAASLSSDSDAPIMLEGTALPLLLEALDPQLWPITQLTSSSLAFAVSTDSSALSSPSTNSVDSLQSFQSLASSDFVQSSGPNSDTQSLSQSNVHSAFPASPQMCLSLAEASSPSAVNPIALSIAVTQALQQIPATALISSTPCSYISSASSFSNSASVSPSASTSTSQTTSSTSSPQLPLPLANDADSVTFLQNREAAAAFLRCMPFPTPKRRSTIHTCSPAAAQPQQFQARPTKAAKLDNSGALSDRSSRPTLVAVSATSSKSEKLPMHLNVPLQAWQCSVPVPVPFSAMDSQSTNLNLNGGNANGGSGNGSGSDGNWYMTSVSRNNLAMALPSSSLMSSNLSARAVSPQPVPQSLLVLQPHPQHFHQQAPHGHGHGHGHSASTGSRLGGSLVVNSKRMEHPVAGEAP